MENAMFTFSTHGVKEPTKIMVEDFEVDTIKDGEFSGLPFIRLNETYDGQKRIAL